MNLTQDLKIVFIVGCQRTGTTLIGNILGAHPQAYLIDEPNGVYPWIEAVFSDQSVDKTNLLFQQCCRKALGNYHKPDIRCSDEGGLSGTITHLILKTPNLTYSAEKIAKYFPDSFCIFTYRDIRDVVVSMSKLYWIKMVCKQLEFMKQNPQILSKYKNEISALESVEIQPHQARAYIAKIKTSLRDTFNHPNIKKLEICYEDMVQEPGVFGDAMLKHLHLSKDKQNISHTEIMRGWGPGLTYRRNKINTLSIGQWQHYLTQKQENQVWEISQSIMLELGYKRVPKAIENNAWNNIKSESKNRPIIATGRGGSGTRLLSEILQNLNIFLGNKLNVTGDSTEWVALSYKLGVERIGQKSSKLSTYWQHPLQETAAEMLIQGDWSGDQEWGWKLPETMLILPEIFDAFNQGKLIHIIRHPVDVCLRRTHMTSRNDHQIGKAVLSASYNELGWEKNRIASDPDYLRNAASWLYQVSEVARFGREQLDPEHYLEIRYEDICSSPINAMENVAKFLGIEMTQRNLEFDIDEQRIRQWNYPDTRADEVWDICKEVALELGYQPIKG